jgi:hypothetical protein
VWGGVEREGSEQFASIQLKISHNIVSAFKESQLNPMSHTVFFYRS